MAVSTPDYHALMHQLSLRNPEIPADVIQDCLVKNNYDVERCAQTLQRLSTQYFNTPHSDLTIQTHPRNQSTGTYNHPAGVIYNNPVGGTYNHPVGGAFNHPAGGDGDPRGRPKYDSGAWIPMKSSSNRHVTIMNFYPSEPQEPSDVRTSPNPNSMETQPLRVPGYTSNFPGSRPLENNSGWSNISPPRQAESNFRIPSPVPPHFRHESPEDYSAHRGYPMPITNQSTRSESPNPMHHPALRYPEPRYTGLHIDIPQERPVSPHFNYPAVVSEASQSPSAVTVIQGISGHGKTITRIRSLEEEPASELPSQPPYNYQMDIEVSAANGGYHVDQDSSSGYSNTYQIGGYPDGKNTSPPKFTRSPVEDKSSGYRERGNNHGANSLNVKADLNEKLNDEAYLQALLTHQKGRFDHLKRKYEEEKKETERERQSVRELEKDLFEKKSLRSPFPSSEQISKLRDDKQKLQIDNECMQAEIKNLKQQVFRYSSPAPPPYPGGFYSNLPTTGPPGPLPPIQHHKQRDPQPGQHHPAIPPPQPEPETEGHTWNCSSCTYTNHADLQSCEICLIPRDSKPQFNLVPHGPSH